jgi:hypothetical protein
MATCCTNYQANLSKFCKFIQLTDYDGTQLHRLLQDGLRRTTLGYGVYVSKVSPTPDYFPLNHLAGTQVGWARAADLPNTNPTSFA